MVRMWDVSHYLALAWLTKLPYSGKFSQGSIFADGQSLPFCKFNFHGCGPSHPLCTVQSSLFRGFNFHGRRSSTKTAKIGSIENFPLYGMGMKVISILSSAGKLLSLEMSTCKDLRDIGHQRHSPVYT